MIFASNSEINELSKMQITIKEDINTKLLNLGTLLCIRGID